MVANSTLTFEGGGLSPAPAPALVAWVVDNRVVYNPVGTEKLAIKFTAKTGVVTATYSDKTTGLRIRAYSVLLQKQGIVSGNFIGNGTTGG